MMLGWTGVSQCESHRRSRISGFGAGFRRKLRIPNQMIRRRQINARRRAPRLRSLGARAGERFVDAAMAVEERVGWPVADRMRAVFEVARWPFERATWTAERRVVWPLGERAAGRGVSGSSLAVSAALVATCAVAALAIVAG